MKSGLTKWYPANEGRITHNGQDIRVIVVRIYNGQIVIPWIYRYTWRFRQEKGTWGNWRSDHPFYYRWCLSRFDWECEMPVNCNTLIEGFYAEKYISPSTIEAAVVVRADNVFVISVTTNVAKLIKPYCNTKVIKQVYMGSGVYLTTREIETETIGERQFSLEMCAHGMEVVLATDSKNLGSVEGDDSQSMTGWIREGIRLAIQDAVEAALKAIPDVLSWLYTLLAELDRLWLLKAIFGYSVSRRYGYLEAVIITLAATKLIDYMRDY